MAYYFCLVTTSTGIKIPSGQSTSDITKFVTTAHNNGARAVITGKPLPVRQNANLL